MFFKSMGNCYCSRKSLEKNVCVSFTNSTLQVYIFFFLPNSSISAHFSGIITNLAEGGVIAFMFAIKRRSVTCFDRVGLSTVKSRNVSNIL